MMPFALLLLFIICFIFGQSTVHAVESTNFYQFSQFTVSDTFVCAIKKRDSTLICWGESPMSTIPSSLINVPVKQVSSGDSHVCVIVSSNDRVVCWGSGDTSSKISGPNTFGEAVKMVSAGFGHTCVVRQSDDTVECFELENPPVEVSSVSSISSGTEVTCVVRKSQGDLKCWGPGILGDEPTNSNLNFLSVGNIHGCALNTTGSAFCWGMDDDSVYGPMSYDGSIAEISAAGSTSCLIDAQTRKASCFGVPLSIPRSDQNPTFLSLKIAYSNLTCGILNDTNELVCVGTSNNYGELDVPIPSTCYGKSIDDPSACSAHGACLNNGTCECDHGYFGDDCSITSCNGIRSDNKLTCGGEGNCTALDTCVCNDFYNGDYCEKHTCFGVDSEDPDVCSSHGICLSPNYCECADDYDGDNCQFFTCFNIPNNMTNLVCSGHGTCTDIDTCRCSSGYVGYDCSIPSCNGIPANMTNTVCSGHGTCTALNQCKCNPGYYGDYCAKAMPVAKIEKSVYVASCGNVNIDGSQSYTTVGTKLTYIWSAPNNTEVDNLLKTLNGSIVSVPVSSFQANGSVLITLQVKNIDNVLSYFASTQVVYNSSAVTSGIIAQISSNSGEQITRSQSLSLSASVKLPTCLTPRPTLTYKWTITGSSNPLSFNTAEVTISPNTLSAGVYNITLAVSNSIDSSVAKETMTIVVLSTPLVAIIEGGQRLVSRASVVELDAGKSYDPDNLGETATYVWSCKSSNCAAFLAALSAGLSKLTIPANSLTNSQRYELCVDYSTPTKAAKRACTFIDVSDGTKQIIDVSFTATHDIVTPRVRSGSIVDSVRFETSISDNSTITCSWTLDGAAISSANGKTTKNVAILYTQPLVPGSQHTLEVNCESANQDAAGRAQTSFTVNSPPTVGSVFSGSTTGIEFSTLFTFVASEFVDDQTPLTYAWTAKNTGDNTVLFQTAASSQNTLDTLLPIGKIEVTVTVYDSLGASSSASLQVTVEEDKTVDQTSETAVVAQMDRVVQNLYFDASSGVSGARNLLVVSELIMKKLEAFKKRRSIANSAALIDTLVDLVNTAYSSISDETVVETSFFNQIATSIYNFATFGGISTNSQNTLFSLSKSMISRPNTQNVNFAELMQQLVGALNVLAAEDSTKLKQLQSEVIQGLIPLIGRGIEDYGVQSFSSDDLNVLIGRYYTPTIQSNQISVPTSASNHFTVQLTADGKNLLLSKSGDTWFYSHVYNYTALERSTAVPTVQTEGSVISPVLNVEVVVGSHDAAAFSDFDDNPFFTLTFPYSTEPSNKASYKCKYLKGQAWVDDCTVTTTGSSIVCSCPHMSQFVVTEEPVITPEDKKKTDKVGLGVGLGIGLGIPLLLIAILIVIAVVVLIVFFVKSRAGNKFTNKRHLTDVELQNVMYRDDHI